MHSGLVTKTVIPADSLGDKTLSGLVTLFIGGGIMISGGGLYEWIIWLANPLYFYGIFYSFKTKHITAKVLCIMAAIIALSFSTWKEILVSESGTMGKIDSLGLGYWLRVLSLILMAIGILYIFEKRDHNCRKG